MNIKVLGPGCSRCHQLEQVVRDVVRELAINASVEEVKDMKKITAYPILMTPGLVINGTIKCSGRIPRPEEIKAWILEAK